MRNILVELEFARKILTIVFSIALAIGSIFDGSN
jgi:hypothetical protein